MPYIEKAGVQTVRDQIEQWKGVMHDPHIDGFNGFYCKQKIMQVMWAATAALENAPSYFGEEEWIQENTPNAQKRS